MQKDLELNIQVILEILLKLQKAGENSPALHILNSTVALMMQ